MGEGESVTAYINTMKEYRSQLSKMGESIAPSTYASTLLRNLPESWRSIAQTIKMVTQDPADIKGRLIADEADLKASDFISQPLPIAFAAQSHIPSNPNNRPTPYRQFNDTHTGRNSPSYNYPRTHIQNGPHVLQNFATRPRYHCNNCGKGGHSASRCFSPGGGLAGQQPWRTINGQWNNVNQAEHTPRNLNPDGNAPQTAHVENHNQATNEPKNIVMMAQISEVADDVENNITTATSTLALSAVHDKSHLWLVDSAASSHICSNIDLFEEIHSMPTISIETASRDAFKANQKGTINVYIQSDVHLHIPPLALTLQNVIFVPKLNANLLLVGRMTSASVNVTFSKLHTTMVMNGQTIARGTKINNLFTYTALPLPTTTHTDIPITDTTFYTKEPNDIEI